MTGSGDDDRDDLRSSAPRIPAKAATFPPQRWEQAVVTKTKPPATLPPTSEVSLPESRPDTGGDRPPTETEARNFIAKRFAAAGYWLQLDYRFTAPGIAVVIDAYDPKQRAGFVYISHTDADVVSDIGPGEELAFKQLYDTGDAFILAVHDRDVDTTATLERIVDAFLAAVHARR